MKKLRQTKYIILLFFVLLGVGIVVNTGLTKSVKYYVTVDELLADQRKFGGSPIKVAGKVSMGTFQKPESGMDVYFQMENLSKVVAVHYAGALPDTFKEGADVVVTGTFHPGGKIEATEVLAKCASRYEEKLEPNYNQRAKEGI